MQSTTNDHTLDNNMFSIVNLLGSIASSSEKGMSFLESINGTINGIVDFVVNDLSNIFYSTKSNINYDKLSSDLLAESLFISKSSNYLLSELVNNLSNNGSKKPKNDVLTIISKDVKSIFQLLSKSKTSKDSDSKDKNTTQPLSNIFKDIKEFADSILVIKKNLDDKLIGYVSKFGDVFNQMVEKITQNKLKKFNLTISDFSKNLTTLGKSLKLVTSSFWMFSLSILAFSLVVISPAFSLAVIGLSAFVWILQKIVSDKKYNNGLKEFAFGIGILTASLLLFRFVDWESTAKLILFIGTLGFALKFFNGVSNVGKSIKNSPLVIFAIGIGILTLSLFAMSEISWESGFKLILFIGALGFIMSLFNFSKKGMKNGMILFALGIGLLVLSIAALQELDWESGAKLLVFIFALGAIMTLFNFNKKGAGNSMLVFALGFGILVLALSAMEELQWPVLQRTLEFLAMLGVVSLLFRNGKNFLMMSFGIIVISAALYVLKKVDIKLVDVLIFVGAVTALGGLAYLMGLPAIAPFIGTGVLVLIGLGVGMLLIAKSIQMINSVKIDVDNIINFMKGVSVIVLGFALLTIPMIPALASALMFVPISIALVLSSLSLGLLNQFTYDWNKSYDFMKSVSILVLGFALLTIPMIPALASSVMFVPVILATLLGATTLALLSTFTFNTKKIDSFILSATKLVEGINNIGLWDLAKTYAKAKLLKPIFDVSLVGIKALSLITNTQLDSNKIHGFTSVLETFVDSVVELLIKNEDKLKQAGPGILALTKIMNLTSSIARVIGMMANMNFYEYGVTNGKLVLKGVRKLKPSDFKLVGSNIATMLETLIQPLIILGSDSSTIRLGGKTLVNPFKSQTAMRGIDTLSRIGNSFKPLAESIKDLASNSIATDPKHLQSFVHSITKITNVFSRVFVALSNSTFHFDKVEDFFKGISDFSKVYSDLPKDYKNITNLDNIFVKFLNSLSDDAKWKKIHKNLQELRKEFSDISKSINSIDIEKATLFERNLKLLIEGNNTKIMKEVLESLKELINGKETTVVNTSGGSTNQPSIVQKVEKVNNVNNDVNNKILEALNIIIGKLVIPELPTVHKVMVINNK